MAIWTPPKTWGSETVPFATLNAQLPENMKVLKTSINDDGTLAVLQAGRLTSDFSKTSDTTLADITGLSFTIAASEIWEFRASIHYDGHSSGDVKFAVTVPSGAIGRYGIVTPAGAPGLTDAAIGTDISSNITITGVDQTATIHGVVVNSTNAGTVQLQMAQNTSNGTATRMFAHSAIVATKIG